MTTDKILEIARRYTVPEVREEQLFYMDGSPSREFTSMTYWKFCEEELIAFAQSILEAERESSDAPVAYLWKSHFIDTGKPIKLWLDEPTWPMDVSSDVPIVPVYTRPAPAQNKLTDEEMNDELVKANVYQAVTAFARAIERRVNGEE